MKKIHLALAAIMGVVLVGSNAMAVTAYDDITASANWADATTAMGVVAAALALALVFRKGAKLVLGFFGR
ncbi:MAG TPA: hypothetical protein VHW71_04225 [Steroidobacteraceae bacterium]|nr:hypothetical protein [Steroidobacteraceae bacterium]